MAVLSAALTGCFPSHESVFSDIRQSRSEAFVRWREGTGAEEMLPSLEGKLSLEDAVKLTLVHSPGIQSILEEKEKARGRVWTAYGEALPTVKVTGGYTRLDEVATVDLGLGPIAMGSKDNWYYQVEVRQPLLKVGAVPAVRGAKFFEFLSDETVRQVVQDAIIRVATAYYDVLLSRHLYDVQAEALEFAKANLRDVSAREAAGVAIPFDTLRARVEVSNVEADMIQQRNRMNRAWTALFRAMGVSQKSQVELDGQLVYVPMTPQYEEAVLKAFTNRPELYQRELDARLQRSALQVYLADYFPQLEGWAWQRWAKPDPHSSSLIQWGRQWSAGLSLTWTLFDGLRREGTIVQQRAALRQALIGLADTEQSVLQEVRNAILDLTDADELVRSQQLNLERANEALRLVTQGAREGVNTELQVLDARSALTRTRGLYYTALHSHIVARLTFQRALGLLGPEPGAAQVPVAAPEMGTVPGFMAPQPSPQQAGPPAEAEQKPGEGTPKETGPPGP
jgi:outer membrane protein TolC